MVAGYETTSITISNSIFILATNQDEQQRLRDEIDPHIESLVIFFVK
jgi:cytochrome P450